MLIAVRHVTSYRYATPTRYSVQSLRLTPADFDGQRVVSWSIDVPGSDRQSRFIDGFGNTGHLISITAEHDSLAITASGVVETSDKAGLIRGAPERSPPRVYLRATPATGPEEPIVDLANDRPKGKILERLHNLNSLIHNAVAYDSSATTSETSAGSALELGKGVCQDHAHIFIAAARSIGVPARYVTGYLLMSDDGSANAHHAWAEAWVDQLGWVGFDPTHERCPTDAYVRLACGLDAVSAAPVRGSRRGSAEEAMDVEVVVQQQQSTQQ